MHTQIAKADWEIKLKYKHFYLYCFLKIVLLNNWTEKVRKTRVWTLKLILHWLSTCFCFCILLILFLHFCNLTSGTKSQLTTCFQNSSLNLIFFTDFCYKNWILEAVHSKPFWITEEHISSCTLTTMIVKQKWALTSNITIISSLQLDTLSRTFVT